MHNFETYFLFSDTPRPRVYCYTPTPVSS